MEGNMKKFIYGLVVILVVIIAVAVALPFIVPIERVKKELITVANDATGRQLAIDGDFSLSIFPVLGLKASDVSFSNAEGAQNPDMVSIESLVLQLNLLPLLSGNVQVDEFVLTKPVINLEMDKNGKGNWIFDSAKSDSAKPSEKNEKNDGEAMDLGISDLNLGDVRIIGGTVRFIDQKSGTNITLDDVNLDVILTGLDDPFEVRGSAVWNAEKTELELKVGSLRAMLENQQTTTNADIKSKNVTLTYGGTVQTLTPLVLSGTTTLDIPSVRNLAAWVGQPLEVEGDSFGPLNVSGEVKVNDTKYSFTNATIAFDKINGVGDFSVDLGGKVPDLVGKLALESLDINPYLPAEKDESATTSTAAPAKKPGEKWDSTPIDLSGFKQANAKFDFSVQEILVKKVKIGRSALAMTLKDAIFNLTLSEFSLYDGSGTGSVRIDAQNPTLKIAKSFSIKGIQLNPLLTDAADFKRLEGTGLFQIDATTTGKSQADMVAALNGSGQFLFEDGSISGVNLAAMARNITTAFTSTGETQKTDFAELSGTFQIKNGVLTNNDLSMLNPFIRLTGAGTVQLPPQTLNYRIEPKLVATSTGQGGSEAAGIAVPIIVSGPWDNLKFAPDLAGVLKNAANPEGIKQLIEGAKGSDGGLKDILKGVKDKDPDAVKSLLDAAGGLFGKKK
ncbi:MAG: AsmA family protein [Sneathiella sp.]|nr:MAG: AsmA family protein [Sneathiella sp.]